MKPNRLIIALALLVLVACLPIPGADSNAPSTLEAQPLPFPTPLPPSQTPPPAATVTATVTPPTVGVKRVLIITVDGLRSDVINLAPMPYLTALMLNSAYTLDAQTIIPNTTLPAHTSMLDGMCVLKHNVRWDEYIPQNGYAIGTDLFDLAHAAGFKTVMIVGKEKLRQITEPQSTDIFKFVDKIDDELVTELISDFPKDFGLMFVHLRDVDLAGHAEDWLSRKQLDTAFIADQEINRILNALDKYGIRKETLIIITADHGGQGENHIKSVPETLTIPWIVTGPGIIPKKLSSYVHITDTAATAAYALGLKIPKEWDGIPVYEAFGLPPVPHTLPVCP